VDHGWSLGSVEHNELEQVAGTIWSEDQVAHRIVADLLDNERVPDGVLDVFRINAVPRRRREEVHTQQSYYETIRRVELRGGVYTQTQQ
jgi:hypothetical protein